MPVDGDPAWPRIALGELAHVKRGAMPSPINDPKWFSDSGHGYVRISDVTASDRILRRTTQYLSDAGKAASVEIIPGDLIMSICGTIGRLLFSGINACIHSGFVTFKAVKTDLIDPEYLYFFLQAHNRYLVAQSQAGTLPNLNSKIVSEIEIPLPPLWEQRKIAEVLASIDQTIALSKRVIAQTKATNASLSQCLLTEENGHGHFNVANTATVAASWAERSLEDLSAKPVTYGIKTPGCQVPGGVPLVRGGDFPNGKISIETLRTISEETAGKYPRTQLKGAEIVISLLGYPGACAVVPMELAGANFARQVALVCPTPEVTLSYLYQFLRSPIGQARLQKEIKGSVQQVINVRDLKQVMITVPPIDKQKQIAATLGDCDDFLNLEYANLTAAAALKETIAAELFSGKVRMPG